MKMMKINSLNNIIEIFAVFSNLTENTKHQLVSDLFEVYLRSHFSSETTEYHLKSLTQRVLFYSEQKNQYPKYWKGKALNEIEARCYSLNKLIEGKEKLLILSSLIGFLPFLKSKKDFSQIFKDQIVDLDEVVKHIATWFNINNEDFEKIKAFETEQYYLIPDTQNLVVVSENEQLKIPEVTNLFWTGIKGYIVFYRFERFNTIVLRANVDDSLLLDDKIVQRRRTYFFNTGNSIFSGNFTPIDYNTILKAFIQHEEQKIALVASNIKYKFKNGTTGLHQLSLTLRSGELNAIMGGSGSGKTTLMNILNGNLKPGEGNVTINGIDVYKSKSLLKGLIGYVPQGDSLNGNLTVFDNLYFAAALSLGNDSKEEITRKVNKLLIELKLYDYRNLKVGTELEKIISGGQRKRLNIACELVREPEIIFLDEPTSGLSSSDSLQLMELLKGFAINGKLVIVNIHQPSPNIFKLFNNLLVLDDGGYPVYFGKSNQIMYYFRKALRIVEVTNLTGYSSESIYPSQIFDFIQTKRVNPDGQLSDKRLKAPERWHHYYLKQQTSQPDTLNYDKVIKNSQFNPPSLIKQFWLYLTRDLKAKVSDKMYVLISVLIAPLLAGFMGLLTRNDDFYTGVYKFSENDNIPSFLLMSVIVASFLGLIGSATEIINEKRTLIRESFIELSYNSFLASKLLYVMFLSFIQIYSYVIISNSILEIKGLTFEFVTILWLTSVFFNVAGLLISSVFNNVSTIYLSIPFILIPQILLSGTVVKFDDLNRFFSSEKYVPIIADVMVSRWAYESMAVDLAMKNKYDLLFYKIDDEINDVYYLQNFLIPEYKDLLSSKEPEKLKSLDRIKKNTNQEIYDMICRYKPGNNLKPENFSEFKELQNSLRFFAEIHDSLATKKDSMIESIDRDSLDALELHRNDNLYNLVTNKDEYKNIVQGSNEFIRKMSPIYNSPKSNLGRAHFFSPDKHIMGLTITTHNFNSIVILIYTISILILVRIFKPKMS